MFNRHQAKYLDNHWTSTKFCAIQFQSDNPKLGKTGRKAMKDALGQAKGYDHVNDIVGDWSLGKSDFEVVRCAIEARNAPASLPESAIPPTLAMERHSNDKPQLQRTTSSQ
jgi:hypothetical protein